MLSERKVVKVSSILRCLSNHVEVNILLSCKCLVQFLFSSGLIRLLDFLILFGYSVNTVFSLVKILFPFLCSSLFCKRCVFMYLSLAF